MRYVLIYLLIGLGFVAENVLFDPKFRKALRKAYQGYLEENDYDELSARHLFGFGLILCLFTWLALWPVYVYRDALENWRKTLKARRRS